MSPEILFENDRIIVCVKPSGVTSEDGAKPGMPELLSNKGKKPLVVHRLDREVGGVMVFAKDASSAASLSAEISDGRFKKEYVAVVEGEVEKSDRLEDLLYHDRRTNKTYTVGRERKGVKRALLYYERIAQAEYGQNTLSLVKIRLETGRTHQIRVQFASRKHPIIGDRKYGSKIRDGFGLFSRNLYFTDPESNDVLNLSADPPAAFPWTLFDGFNT